MNKTLTLTVAGAAVLAAGIAGAQTYAAIGQDYRSDNGVRMVRCESTGSRRNFCRVDARGGVQLSRQLSRQACIRGRTWQATADGISVAGGCRAEFVVLNGYGYGYNNGYYNNGYNNHGYQVYDGTYTTDRYGRRVYDDRYNRTGYYGNDGNTIHCQSNGYGRTYCGVRGNHYMMVDRSPSCVSNRTVGDDSYGTWVSGNCNADFRLRTYTGYSNTGNDPYYDPRGYEPVYSSGSYPTTSSSYGRDDIVYCRAGASGRTYCGDRNTGYSIRYDSSSSCLLGHTYGRDSYGTWVSGNCNLTLVPND